MAPDPDRRSVSFPQIKYPLYRDVPPKIPAQWIASKRIQDGAEGMWRIHDKLYDLTDFVAKHPGGADWLTTTKGTDITEQFETHHLKGIAEELLPKYYVKDATSPRNSPFTFKEHDFYKTLKVKVIEKLKGVPKVDRLKSNLITDSILISVLILAPLSCWSWSQGFLLGAVFTFLSSFALSGLNGCGHNYFHRADNWRMYVFNLGGFSYADWRISHAMSHHLHTNTMQDMELSLLDPIILFFPAKYKPLYSRFAVFYHPIVYSIVPIMTLVSNILSGIIRIKGKNLYWSYLIPFMLPLWMIVTSGQNLSLVLLVWLTTISLASLIFIGYGLTAGHHSHTNFFEGDIPKSEYLDWGLHQMDTVVERSDYIGYHIKSITRFGDHALHHLFPTLDNAEVKYLYPILLEHCEKFETKLRTMTFYESVVSHWKQMLRTDFHDFKLPEIKAT